MLKRYKNAFLEMIQAAGLDVNDFTGGEQTTMSGGPAFVIRYNPADLTFTAQNSEADPHAFDYYYTVYAPGFSQPLEPYFYPEEGYINFNSVREGFENWLSRQVRTAIDEELLPDLWTTATHDLVAPNEAYAGRFSEEERQQLKLALSTFRVLLVETFEPTKEQLQAVSERLDYLSAAIDRLNKFDWRGVAISTLLSITTTLTLDTEKGRQLYGLFQQALSTLMHLIR
ncbi:MAG: hypothetical protein WD688_11725 [Candidatus Binatia bacterium]